MWIKLSHWMERGANKSNVILNNNVLLLLLSAVWLPVRAPAVILQLDGVCGQHGGPATNGDALGGSELFSGGTATR